MSSRKCDGRTRAVSGPHNGAVWFHNTKVLSMAVKQVVRSLWLRSQNAGVARNKAHDRAHGIQKIMKHIANYGLLCV